MDFRLPELSPGLEFATVAGWRKGEGAQIEAGDPIVDVEADKVTYELEAPAAGILAEIIAAEGDEIQVGALLARLEPL